MIKLTFITFLSLTSLGFTTTTKKLAVPKETYYYFCLSREVPADDKSTAKRQIVYTAIQKLTGDRKDIHQLSKRFADYINKSCKPGNEMCTSDLNYYPNRQQAEQRRKSLLASFEATGNYEAKQIDVILD